MKTYTLGNCLRGYTEGDFGSMDEAWSVLSRAFSSVYPSTAGRHVYMSVRETNPYGFEDNLICKKGLSCIEPITDEELNKCRRATYI